MATVGAETPRQTEWAEEYGVTISEEPDVEGDVRLIIQKFTRGDEVLFFGNDPRTFDFDELSHEHRQLILDNLANAAHEQEEAFKTLPVGVQLRISSVATTIGLSESSVAPFFAHLNQVVLRQKFNQRLTELED